MDREKAPFFMAKIEGPPKQFAILVGDDNEVVGTQIQTKSIKTHDEQPNIYIISNSYYCSKYGLQNFANVREVLEDYKKNESVARPYFAVVYKGLQQLREAEKVAEIIKADTRIVIFESLESLGDEAGEAEALAALLAFDWVYLNPTEEQITESEEMSEKYGIDRILETMEVCTWPWRVANLTKDTGMLDFPVEQSPIEENVKDSGGAGVMTDNAAETLTHNYAMWMRMREAEQEDLGLPQRAEHVHLSSSGSPTTTEGTVNQEENNITVDFDFVNKKSNLQDDNEGSSSTSQKKQKSQ